MTPFGVPETEREATVLGLDARPGALDGFDGRLSAVEAAEALGVAVHQVLRWAEDGTIPAECLSGRPARAAGLRIDAAWVRGMVDRLEEVRL